VLPGAMKLTWYGFDDYKQDPYICMSVKALTLGHRTGPPSQFHGVQFQAPGAKSATLWIRRTRGCCCWVWNLSRRIPDCRSSVSRENKQLTKILYKRVHCLDKVKFYVFWMKQEAYGSQVQNTKVFPFRAAPWMWNQEP
jgi:hypothetical protein